MEKELIEIYKENSGKSWPVVMQAIKQKFPHISKHQLSAIINNACMADEVAIMFFYIKD